MGRGKIKRGVISLRVPVGKSVGILVSVNCLHERLSLAECCLGEVVLGCTGKKAKQVKGANQ